MGGHDRRGLADNCSNSTAGVEALWNGLANADDGERHRRHYADEFLKVSERSARHIEHVLVPDWKTLRNEERRGIAKIDPINNRNSAVGCAPRRRRDGWIDRRRILEPEDEDAAHIRSVVPETAYAPERLSKRNASSFERDFGAAAGRTE